MDLKTVLFVALLVLLTILLFRLMPIFFPCSNNDKPLVNINLEDKSRSLPFLPSSAAAASANSTETVTRAPHRGPEAPICVLNAPHRAAVESHSYAAHAPANVSHASRLATSHPSCRSPPTSPPQRTASTPECPTGVRSRTKSVRAASSVTHAQEACRANTGTSKRVAKTVHGRRYDQQQATVCLRIPARQWSNEFAPPQHEIKARISPVEPPSSEAKQTGGKIGSEKCIVKPKRAQQRRTLRESDKSKVGHLKHLSREVSAQENIQAKKCISRRGDDSHSSVDEPLRGAGRGRDSNAMSTIKKKKKKKKKTMPVRTRSVPSRDPNRPKLSETHGFMQPSTRVMPPVKPESNALGIKSDKSSNEEPKEKEDKIRENTSATLHDISKPVEPAGRYPTASSVSAQGKIKSCADVKPGTLEEQETDRIVKNRSDTSKNQAEVTKVCGGKSVSEPQTLVVETGNRQKAQTSQASQTVQTRVNSYGKRPSGNSLTEFEPPLKKQRRSHDSIFIGDLNETSVVDAILQLDPGPDILRRMNLVSFHERPLREILEDLREKCELLEHTNVVCERARSLFAECVNIRLIDPCIFFLPHPSRPCFQSACVLLAGYACDEKRETSEVCKIFGTKDRNVTIQILLDMKQCLSLQSVTPYTLKQVQMMKSGEYSRELLARYCRRSMAISEKERRIAENLLCFVHDAFFNKSTWESTKVAVSLNIVLSETKKSDPFVVTLIQDLTGIQASTIEINTIEAKLFADRNGRSDIVEAQNEAKTIACEIIDD